MPVLRKDFIVDEYQLFEARAAGADAVLLIVAALDQGSLVRLQQHAWDLGLAALVEVHDDAEVPRAIDSGARVIGVNNRNLHTLAVDVDTSYARRTEIPADVVAVSESGLRTRRRPIHGCRPAGYRAFLIGERFATAPDPARALRDLLGRAEAAAGRRQASWRGRGAGACSPKICGITGVDDARHAVEHGATALGFIFWPQSPRYNRARCTLRAIIAALPQPRYVTRWRIRERAARRPARDSDRREVASR